MPSRAADIRPIPGWEGYFASWQGDIFSSKKGVLKKLKSYREPPSYPRVSLCRNGEIIGYNVHTLVALTFLGERPPHKDLVRHLDGNPSNNAVSNLAYGTYAENEADKEVHGRRLRGHAVAGSKLTEDDVLQIRHLYMDGYSQNAIAETFGLNPTTVFRVIHGELWTHLPVPDYSTRKPRVAVGSWNAGASHGSAKLDEGSARAAMELVRKGLSTRDVARQFGVSRQAICHLANGRTWKHLHVA